MSSAQSTGGNTLTGVVSGDIVSYFENYVSGRYTIKKRRDGASRCYANE